MQSAAEVSASEYSHTRTLESLQKHWHPERDRRIAGDLRELAFVVIDHGSVAGNFGRCPHQLRANVGKLPAQCREPRLNQIGTLHDKTGSRRYLGGAIDREPELSDFFSDRVTSLLGLWSTGGDRSDHSDRHHRS